MAAFANVNDSTGPGLVCCMGRKDDYGIVCVLSLFVSCGQNQMLTPLPLTLTIQDYVQVMIIRKKERTMSGLLSALYGHLP